MQLNVDHAPVLDGSEGSAICLDRKVLASLKDTKGGKTNKPADTWHVGFAGHDMCWILYDKVAKEKDSSHGADGEVKVEGNSAWWWVSGYMHPDDETWFHLYTKSR